MMRIGVLVSGGGTNLQALLDSPVLKSGCIVTVVSSKEGVYALERAKKHGINYAVICKKSYENADDFDRAILKHMKDLSVDVIVMAGFLSIVGEALLEAYPNKIINVHPSLIPSFCGNGHYGIHVHEKALQYGVKVTGATVHFVNSVADGGAIIMQKCVDILENDTPESLQLRVMQEAEWQILPLSLELLCSNRLEVKGRKVMIR